MMRCTTCGLTTSRVLETRTMEYGVWRRYKCADGHRWSTYELVDSVVKAIGPARVKECAGRVERGIKARQRAESTRELVLHLLEQGGTATSAALEAGVTEARVRQIRAASAPTTSQPGP